MSDTPITPSAGAITLAGVALTLIAGTATVLTPSAGSASLSGVAPSPVSQLQARDIPGTVNLLKSDSQTTGANIKLWFGGVAVMNCVGNFAGATVTLQMLGADGQTWVTCGTSTTFTSNGVGLVYLPRCKVQALISGGSGSTSVTAALQPVPDMIG
jgi:hypothetical protein